MCKQLHDFVLHWWAHSTVQVQITGINISSTFQKSNSTNIGREPEERGMKNAAEVCSENYSK